jgi:hypothetical protein
MKNNVASEIKCIRLIPYDKCDLFLISNFRHVLNVVFILLGDSLTSELYVPMFQNTVSVPSRHCKQLSPPMKMEQTECSETLSYKIRHRGITQKKENNKCNPVHRVSLKCDPIDFFWISVKVSCCCVVHSVVQCSNLPVLPTLVQASPLCCKNRQVAVAQPHYACGMNTVEDAGNYNTETFLCMFSL